MNGNSVNSHDYLGLTSTTIPDLPTWTFYWARISDRRMAEYLHIDKGREPTGSCSKHGEIRSYHEDGDLMDRWQNLDPIITIKRDIWYDWRFRIIRSTRIRKKHFKKYTSMCECLCRNPDRHCRWKRQSGFEDVWLDYEKIERVREFIWWPKELGDPPSHPIHG